MTFALPTFVADGTLQNRGVPAYVVDGSIVARPKLPTYVADGSLVETSFDVPTPVLGAGLRSVAFLPTAIMTPLYYVYTPVGGAVMGGAANIVGQPYIPVGGAVMGGAATIIFPYLPSGGMKMSGAAVVDSVVVNIYNINNDFGAVVGGMAMGGAARIQDNVPITGAGGMVMGGAAPVSEHIPYTSSGGGTVMGGTAPVNAVFGHVPSGGAVMGGSAPSSVAYAIQTSGGAVMGGAAVVRDYQAFYQPVGGAVMSGAALVYFVPVNAVATTENPGADTFPGWAMNLETQAVTRYMSLPANSITQFAGRSFVANAGGIYEIGADDDAGQPIYASIQLPTTDYGQSRIKYMEVAYVGIQTVGKMRVKVSVNKQKSYYYPITANYSTPEGERIPIGKGLRGRYWGIRLDNIGGTDFELESLEFNPVAGQQHGA